MITKSFNGFDPQQYDAVHASSDLPTTMNQMEQPTTSTLRAEAAQQAKTKRRMSTDETIAFWSCMVPCGWSIGGLVAFLLSRKQKGRASKQNTALRSLLFGLLSTLCYLMAVLQAEKYGVVPQLQQPETGTPVKAQG